MTKTKKQDAAAEAAPEVDNVNPLDTPDKVSGLPTTWERSEGENLPVAGEKSAPLDREDFLRPKVHLGQRTGDLGTQFGLGSFILNKEIGMTKAVGEELKIIVLRHPTKYFMEDLEYEVNGPLPKRYESIEEVEEAGLTLSWDNVNNIAPTACRAARVLLLILKPESLPRDPGFSMTIEGLGNCAIAEWLLVHSSYKSVATRLFTAEQLDLKGQPLASLVWKLKSVERKGKKGPFYLPTISPDQRLSDEVVETLKTTFNLK